MNITCIFTGKTTDKNVAALLTEYKTRIERYSTIRIVETPPLKLSTAAHITLVQQKEFDQQKKYISGADYLILLDENGKHYTSAQFAGFIQKKQIESRKHLVFITGGAFGFAPALRNMAHETIALSHMTFPHELVRVLFAEQLYRAFTILRNEQYHH
jgi:23S rRNA (pseudouridine1915-N3)-methyltransferase